MKRIVSLFLGTLCLLSAFLAFGKDTTRRAIVTDSAGVTTEVPHLSSSTTFSRFDMCYTNHPLYPVCEDGNGIVVSVDGVFDVAVPFDSLMSLDVDKGIATVVYELNDKVKTLTTKVKLQEDTLHGKSDFGDVEFSTGHLRKIVFKDPPVVPKQPTVRFNTTLVLKDGSSTPVSLLKRCDYYFSTAGYVSGGRTECGQYDDIRSLRGSSLATIDFKNIQKIVFGSEKDVKVTLKNGNVVAGTLTKQDGAEVECFTGVYSEGYFFISPKNVSNVREIRFGD